MPRITDETRAARRQHILDAARRCFARKGFSATTIAELCEEAGVSAGGIYTHFENKHAIAEAIGGDATSAQEGEPADLASMGERLLTSEGLLDARLDLQLWAESLHDAVLHEMVTNAMDRFRSTGSGSGDEASVAVVEALVLGTEVQRALGRPIDLSALARVVALLASTEDSGR